MNGYKKALEMSKFNRKNWFLNGQDACVIRCVVGGKLMECSERKQEIRSDWSILTVQPQPQLYVPEAN